MNYDHGQIRGHVPRMPNDYGPRGPNVPSGYPANALPGNNGIRYGYQHQQQPQMGYMGYDNKFYPGDNRFVNSQSYYQGGQPQQAYYPQPQPQQAYPQQQQQQPSSYPTTMQQNYPQSNPSLVNPGLRVQPQQGFQQPTQPSHPGAMMDGGGGQYGMAFVQGNQYQQQQAFQQHQRFPMQYPTTHQYASPQPQPIVNSNPQQQQQQPQMQPLNNQQMMHSNVNQRPPPPFVRGGPHPVRTGFRNPGPTPAYLARPMRPMMAPQQQQQFYQQQQSQNRPQGNWNMVQQPPQQSQQPQQPPMQQEENVQPTPPMMVCTTSGVETPVASSFEAETQQPVTSNESQNVMVTSTMLTTMASSSVMVSSTSSVASSDSAMVSATSTEGVVSTAPIIPMPQHNEAIDSKVLVPWGWVRTALSDQVIYKSPSGIELKSKEDVREYLLKEGTCKCGLECPLELDTAFNFDVTKLPEMAPIPESPPNPAKYCSHKAAIANLARIMSSPGYSNQFKHIHDPTNGKKGLKKKARKKRPYSGILTPQMIEAREAERRRINEIISQQKKEYEAQMSLSVGGRKSAKIVIKPGTSKEVKPRAAKEPPPLKVIEEESVESEDPENGEKINNAKNVEIRRISATEEGDKVLEGAWDSPEKDKEEKTPLQMVQSIVSKIEETKPPVEVAPPPPAWTQGGSHRPLLHSQKQVANDTPPSSRPLPVTMPTSSVAQQQQPPSLVQKTPITQNITVMAPTTQLVPVSASGPQFMQLVNTINGPMLMQTIAAPQPQIQIQQDKNKPIKKASPTGPMAYQAANPVPILVSPTTMMANSQPSPTGAVAPAQHVLISHPSPGSGVIQGAPQFVLNQPAMIAPNQVFLSANGALVAMPTAPAVQGVVYNQLPDGTLVQVQSPVIQQPQPQTVFTSNGSFVINNAGQQISPTGGQIQFQAATNPGTYIMTPTGLVQTVTTQASPLPTPTLANPGPSGIENPGSTVLSRKESTEDSDDDSDRDDDTKSPHLVKFVPTDEDEEEDEESSDEELPLAHRKISPKSKELGKGKGGKIKTSSPKIYIQSNKVDSSGLQATPPHPNEESESSMNKLSSPEAVSTSRYDAHDTSGSTDGSGPSSSTKSPHKRRRKRNADEMIKQDSAPSLDSDESEDEEKSTKTRTKQFSVGELVWGPHGTFPSWPGKLVRFERDGSKVLVCWFGNRDTSQVNPHYLKSLSDGLEAHHRERKKLRKGRKMNASLEKAIQEAMMELDRMTDD